MTKNDKRFVFDSFALLAHLEDEAGAERVRAVLKLAERNMATIYVSLMNVGELIYITERERGLTAAQLALSALDQLPIEKLETTRERILSAAHIKANYALSYADAFVVAAAEEMGAVVLTGDPEFAAVEKRVNVEWLAKRNA